MSISRSPLHLMYFCSFILAKPLIPINEQESKRYEDTHKTKALRRSDTCDDPNEDCEDSYYEDGEYLYEDCDDSYYEYEVVSFKNKEKKKEKGDMKKKLAETSQKSFNKKHKLDKDNSEDFSYLEDNTSTTISEMDKIVDFSYPEDNTPTTLSEIDKTEDLSYPEDITSTTASEIDQIDYFSYLEDTSTTSNDPMLRK